MMETIHTQTNKENDKSKLFSRTKTNKAKNSRTTANTVSKSSAAQDAKLITHSLQRTKQMMHQELNRLNAVAETIDKDGKILNQTKDEHLGMKGGIRGAKGSLGKLKLKEREDQIIFWSSVIFFYLVVLYVLWTRIRIPFLLW
jgi:hypothetical protein